MTGRDKDIITSGDLDTILDVNKKAIELHEAVGRQNEDILENLAEQDKFMERSEEKLDDILRIVKETHTAIKTNIENKIDEIEKNLFRLIVILSTIGVGTVIAIVQSFLHH
jgi:biopolymer transport protein ExbB/TolQ